MKGWSMKLWLEGYNILFADYEKAIIDILIEYPDEDWGSGKMHRIVRHRGIDISRASVIFYLNFLVDRGIATYTTATGKGGHHKLYSITRTEEDVKKLIVTQIVEGLFEALDVDLDWLLEKWL